VQIARIWGIGIAVHASWLVVFALVAWSLAAGYFPTEFPGWAPVTYWLTGTLTALVFFLSILIHELGHSWVALRYGIPIRSITLFVFGGVAQISREPARGSRERMRNGRTRNRAMMSPPSRRGREWARTGRRSSVSRDLVRPLGAQLT